MVDSHGRSTIKQRITGENALHQSIMGNTLSSLNKTKQSFFTTSSNENNFLMSVVPSWSIVTAVKDQYRLYVYINGYSAPVIRNSIHRIVCIHVISWRQGRKRGACMFIIRILLFQFTMAMISHHSVTWGSKRFQSGSRSRKIAVE